MTQEISPIRGTSKINRQFFIYYINITQTNPDLTTSVHLELKPLNKTNSYVIIYKFDEAPVYNSTHTSIDGSTMFCSEGLFHLKFKIINKRVCLSLNRFSR